MPQIFSAVDTGDVVLAGERILVSRRLETDARIGWIARAVLLELVVDGPRSAEQLAYGSTGVRQIRKYLRELQEAGYVTSSSQEKESQA